MNKLGTSLALALAGIVLIISVSFSAQQSDPFYLGLLEKAQRSFLAKNYGEAAQDFEVAAFGLASDKALQAKAYVYLGLCRYYLKDMQASERSLREAAAIMGEEGFASLEIYESAWPDLEKLTAFFSLAAGKNEALPEEMEKPLPPDPILDRIKEGDIVPLDLVDTPPVAIRKVSAAYPEHAGSLRIEGTVTVKILVSEKGDVVDAKILTGIKNAVEFDRSALNAVRRWKFEPATVKGIKVKVWISVAIEFKKTPSLSLRRDFTCFA